MEAAMRALGIDPGLAVTGWGIVERRDDRLHYIASGTIKTLSGGGQSSRLLRLWLELERSRIRKHKCEIAAIENSFVGAGRQAAVKTAEAVGVIKLWLEYRCAKVTEFAPTSIKKAVAGNGHASKDEMKSAVASALAELLERRSRSGYVSASEHENDALAAAIMLLRQ